MTEAILRHRNRGERGAAAVEFALIALLLFMLVFGIIEYGRIFSQLEVYNSAAREGARTAAVRASVDDIQARIVEAAAPYEVAGPINFSVSGGGAGDPPCDDDTSGEQVTVSWNQPMQISIGILPSFNQTIEIRGVFRCE